MSAAGDSVSASAASKRVAEVLRNEILAGKLQPGERIRQEAVAERTNQSRLPVREALRTLEAEGLVINEPNKGARVASLELHEFDALYRIRERLEPMALAESIPNLTRADIDQLGRIQTAIESCPELGEFVMLDRELHLLTYSGCRIDQLNTIVNRLWNATQHYRRAFIAHLGLQRRWMVSVEHRLLIDSIERGDITEAEMIMTMHIRRTRIELIKHPTIFGTGHISPLDRTQWLENARLTAGGVGDLRQTGSATASDQ